MPPLRLRGLGPPHRRRRLPRPRLLRPQLRLLRRLLLLLAHRLRPLLPVHQEPLLQLNPRPSRFQSHLRAQFPRRPLRRRDRRRLHSRVLPLLEFQRLRRLRPLPSHLRARVPGRGPLGPCPFVLVHPRPRQAGSLVRRCAPVRVRLARQIVRQPQVRHPVLPRAPALLRERRRLVPV
jgi:hypothetical protein